MSLIFEFEHKIKTYLKFLFYVQTGWHIFQVVCASKQMSSAQNQDLPSVVEWDSTVVEMMICIPALIQIQNKNFVQLVHDICKVLCIKIELLNNIYKICWNTVAFKYQKTARFCRLNPRYTVVNNNWHNLIYHSKQCDISPVWTKINMCFFLLFW